jgi:hypothetical protein
MIKVTEKYYIHAEPKCYILKEKSIVQDESSENFGKERFKEIGYFTTIEEVIEGVLKLKLREFINKSVEGDLKDIKNEIAKQTEYLKSLKLDV